MRTVLLIAFHFPPCSVSSGLQRTLSIAKYLAKGERWRPVVLSASPGAYPRTSEDQLADIPEGVQVVRAAAFDATKRLSIRGRYPRFLALPDRWYSWYFSAVPAGRSIIRKARPDVIWSTFPLATAHAIAATLARRSGIPWVADFRDPMVEKSKETGRWYPVDDALRVRRMKIERRAAQLAARLVFCSPGAARLTLERYPEVDGSHPTIIPNGFDPEIFDQVEAGLQPGEADDRERLTLVHSGTLYRGKTRDATPFLEGLARYLGSDDPPPGRLRVLLRATSSDPFYSEKIEALGLTGTVELLPAVPYREAIAEMLRADGLLLFQGASSNTAIPAKLYEYVGARRPILAFVDPGGDTADVLRRIPSATTGPIDDPQRIAATLSAFVARLARGEPISVSEQDRRSYSREAGVQALADLLDQVADRRSAAVR